MEFPTQKQLLEKWNAVLDHKDHAKISDPYRRSVTAVLLENQLNWIKEERQNNPQLLTEAAPTNNFGDGNIKSWDPILISLVRRSLPNLIAYDVAGVQPMTAPTGLIFALKSRYTNQTGSEALFNEADTDFSGKGTHAGDNPLAGGFTTGEGFTTAEAEALGDGVGTDFAEMAFSIDKVTVTARSRALKAEYTMELAQDLKAVHGLEAETELANILSSEILTEINREVIRKIYFISEVGAQHGVSVAGTFDLDTDSNGRWMAEKFKGLLFQVEREANQIAKNTRRGKGNIIIASSDVASALAMSGALDYAPALATNLNVDDTGNTFAGVLLGRFKVYVDPYFGGQATNELLVVGYKGTSPYDSGFFYCPYVPLQMVRAVGENSFQPKIGFKTRYGIVPNPFYTDAAGAVNANSNPYYRRVKVTNLL